MNDVLKQLLGQTMEMHSSYRDVGVLVAYDDRWIQIEKSDCEMLYFAIHSVRLLKTVR